MYESFFELAERPFAAAPQVKRFFPAAAIEAARQTLARTIERAEGPALLIGPAGTGKTLLCQALADQFRKRFAIALLASGRLCTRRSLLQAILFELGLPYRSLEEGELRLSLIDHLSQRERSGEGLVLLIDEAHTLPVRLLEEVRMITNLVRDGQPRVRVVISGSPALEERFASPKLESFNQRLSARCYLHSLDRNETLDYVRRQIQSAGGRPEFLIDDAALDAVFRATDGIPRLINQVCDHALILAYTAGQRQLNKSIIEEAWADLQQLPTPWTAAEGAAAPVNDSVIEFGTFDGESLATDLLVGDGSEPDVAALPFPVASVAPEIVSGPASAVEQLEQIERQLASLDDDFQPAGTIGPEVELVFPSFSNPFSEKFLEEEVVIDRYASLDSTVLKGRPTVTSREGRELGKMLTPLASPAATPIEKTVEPALAIDVFEEDEIDVDIDFDDELQSPSADAEANADDSDVILVEDDPHPLASPTIRNPQVRRQEYRQLFAKLRKS